MGTQVKLSCSIGKTDRGDTMNRFFFSSSTSPNVSACALLWLPGLGPLLSANAAVTRTRVPAGISLAQDMATPAASTPQQPKAGEPRPVKHRKLSGSPPDAAPTQKNAATAKKLACALNFYVPDAPIRVTSLTRLFTFANLRRMRSENDSNDRQIFSAGCPCAETWLRPERQRCPAQRATPSPPRRSV